MNKLTIIGNLARDPELRTVRDGISVCDFTVAVNRRGSRQNAAVRLNKRKPALALLKLYLNGSVGKRRKLCCRKRQRLARA